MISPDGRSSWNGKSFPASTAASPGRHQIDLPRDLPGPSREGSREGSGVNGSKGFALQPPNKQTNKQANLLHSQSGEALNTSSCYSSCTLIGANRQRGAHARGRNTAQSCVEQSWTRKKSQNFSAESFSIAKHWVFLIKGSASCGVLSQRTPDMRSKGPFPASPLDWND